MLLELNYLVVPWYVVGIYVGHGDNPCKVADEPL